MGYRDYSTAKGHIVDATGHGDFTTVQAAITAASSGQTIFIRPGTYTENVTLASGVNLIAFQCDSGTFNSNSATNHVNIVGTLTANFASGTVVISGIGLTTNNANVLVNSSTGTVNLFNCYINATNNTAISMTAAGFINLSNCNGNLGTSGISYISMSNGTLFITEGVYTNLGGSTTASTVSGGLLDIIRCIFANSITTSSSGALNSHFVIYEGVGNNTVLTLNGTGTGEIIDYCTFNSGTASAISVGAGVATEINHSSIESTNANAITGAGSVSYSNLVFLGTSNAINTTTQVGNFSNIGKMITNKQPAFSANGAGAASVTGDGTAYTIGSSGTAWIEIYDYDSNFNTNGTFTAPSDLSGTHIYHFTGSVGLTGIDATNTGLIPQLVTSNRSYTGSTLAPFPVSVGGALVLNFSCDADMEAGDTAVFQISVFGSTKNVSVQASAVNTFFQGRLLF